MLDMCTVCYVTGYVIERERERERFVNCGGRRQERGAINYTSDATRQLSIAGRGSSIANKAVNNHTQHAHTNLRCTDRPHALATGKSAGGKLLVYKIHTPYNIYIDIE